MDDLDLIADLNDQDDDVYRLASMRSAIWVAVAAPTSGSTVVAEVGGGGAGAAPP
jgi:hypothetical protein